MRELCSMYGTLGYIYEKKNSNILNKYAVVCRLGDEVTILYFEGKYLLPYCIRCVGG